MKFFASPAVFFMSTMAFQMISFTEASSSNASLRRNKRDDGSKKDDGKDDNNNDSVYIGAIVTVEHVTPPKGTVDGWNHDLLTEALVVADNKVNTNSKYHAVSGFVSKYVNVPEDGNFCPEKDDASDENGFYDLHWTYVRYDCGMFCGIDDDYILEGKQDYLNPMGVFLEVSNGRSPQNHKALEAEVCRHLRESGEPALASITECSVDYVYNGDEDMMRFGPAKNKRNYVHKFEAMATSVMES